MRLIDADAVNKKLAEEMARSVIGMLPQSYREGLMSAKMFIDTTPDGSSESKKTRWIPVDPDSRDYTDEYDCESCQRTVHLSYYTKVCDYEFCPFCGRKAKWDD